MARHTQIMNEPPPALPNVALSRENSLRKVGLLLLKPHAVKEFWDSRAFPPFFADFHQLILTGDIKAEPLFTDSDPSPAVVYHGLLACPYADGIPCLDRFIFHVTQVKGQPPFIWLAKRAYKTAKPEHSCLFRIPLSHTGTEWTGRLLYTDIKLSMCRRWMEWKFSQAPDAKLLYHAPHPLSVTSVKKGLPKCLPTLPEKSSPILILHAECRYNYTTPHTSGTLHIAFFSDSEPVLWIDAEPQNEYHAGRSVRGHGSIFSKDGDQWMGAIQVTVAARDEWASIPLHVIMDERFDTVLFVSDDREYYHHGELEYDSRFPAVGDASLFAAATAPCGPAIVSVMGQSLSITGTDRTTRQQQVASLTLPRFLNDNKKSGRFHAYKAPAQSNQETDVPF